MLLLVSSCGFSGTSAYQLSSSAVGGHMITSQIASSGCGKAAPFVPGLSVNETIRSGGYERMYRIHLPTNYYTNRVQPLILNFHGHSSTAAAQEKLTKLSSLADQQDFIAVYPQGLIGPDHLSGWATGPAWDPQVNDVLFVSDLLNTLQAKLCVDPLRIYAMGFSNGGGMTNLLAARLAGRIAAFASVSGSYYPVPGGYHPVRPVPLLEIHGTGDHIVPYNGDVAKDYSSVTRWLLGWVQRDQCSGQPDVILHQKTMIGEQWSGCQGGATVIHYRILHEDHIWPSVQFRTEIQKKACNLNATALIWQFFQDHPMTGRQKSRYVAVTLRSTSKQSQIRSFYEGQYARDCKESIVHTL